MAGIIPGLRGGIGATHSLGAHELVDDPFNAIYFDWKHGSMWGGASHGEDYGIAW